MPSLSRLSGKVCDEMLSMLRCPVCRKYLTQVRNGNLVLVCNECSSSYPLRQGIIDFDQLDKKGQLEGFWPKCYVDLYGKVARHLHISNDVSALSHNMSKLGSDIYDFDHDRVGWLSLLPEDCNEMALDTGCGRGAITSLLAKRFKIVFAVDGHFESLRVAKARIDAMELRNVIFLRSDLTQELPFSDCIFDVVTLIGVLEWVPTVRMNADPRIVQLNLLKELRRVLKPGGRLVLGIENRFSISYWLGKVDHHSGMRFAPLLPRFLANVYSKALRGKPYRTYLHSFSGYSSLLREAGFKHYRFFLPLPGYVHPRILVPLDHSLKIVGYTFKQHGKSFGLKKVVKDLGINTLDWLGILQRFVDEFIIVSKK